MFEKIYMEKRLLDNRAKLPKKGKVDPKLKERLTVADKLARYSPFRRTFQSPRADPVA